MAEQFSPDHLERLRGRLRAEEESISRRLDRMVRQGAGESLSGSVGELSRYDNHPGDLGTETYEREKDLGSRWRLEEQLEQVRAALGRMDQGTYGVCESCGQWVEADRLEALPQARRCARCEARRSGRPQESFRPAEEERLEPAFARGWDEPDSIAYDAEDAWQDVARYGSSDTPADVPGARDYGDAYAGGHEERGTVQSVEALVTNWGDPMGGRDEVEARATGWEAVGKGEQESAQVQAQNRRTRRRRGRRPEA